MRRTGIDVIYDLHRLLASARLTGPYILVGHSMGGPLVRLYASRFPEQVIGMILLDSSHEDDFSQLIAAGAAAEDVSFPPPDQNSEKLDVPALYEEVRQAQWRTSIPLLVVTPEWFKEPHRAFPHATREQIPRLEATWLELQKELVTRAPNGRLVIVPNTGHHMHRDQPARIIELIRQFVTDVRRN